MSGCRYREIEMTVTTDDYDRSFAPRRSSSCERELILVDISFVFDCSAVPCSVNRANVHCASISSLGVRARWRCLELTVLYIPRLFNDFICVA